MSAVCWHPRIQSNDTTFTHTILTLPHPLCRDAKLSAVCWDPRAHTLRTASLHSFESDPSLRGGREAFAAPPRVLADPLGRCAAVVMFDHQLALLPAASPSAGGGIGGSARLKSSLMINLAKLDKVGAGGAGVQEVREAVFLHGYAAPTLLVLHEPDPTWAGRYRERRDTCAVLALSLSWTAKRPATRLWAHSGLPSCCHALVPIPGRAAALVVSSTLVMYVTSQGVLRALRFGPAPPPPGTAPPPRLEFNSAVEAPATTAARVAREHALSIHPDARPAMSSTAVPAAPATVATAAAAAAGVDGGEAGAWAEEGLEGCKVAWLGTEAGLLLLGSGRQVLLRLQYDGRQFRNMSAVPLSRWGPAPTAVVSFLQAGMRSLKDATAAPAALTSAASLGLGLGGGFTPSTPGAPAHTSQPLATSTPSSSSLGAPHASPLGGAWLAQHTVFIGSYSGDAQLLGYSITGDPRQQQWEALMASALESSRPQKRQRTEDGAAAAGAGTGGDGGAGGAARQVQVRWGYGSRGRRHGGGGEKAERGHGMEVVEPSRWHDCG